MSRYFKKTEPTDNLDEKSKFHTNSQIQRLFNDYSFDLERYLKQKELIRKMEEDLEKEREKQKRSTSDATNSGVTATTRIATKQLTTVNSFAKIG